MYNVEIFSTDTVALILQTPWLNTLKVIFTFSRHDFCFTIYANFLKLTTAFVKTWISFHSVTINAFLQLAGHVLNIFLK